MSVYTTPTTRTTGDLITASIWNTDLVENIKVMDVVGFDYVIDGGGAAITTGIKYRLRIPFPMSVSDVSVTGDQAGSADFDILYKATWDSDVVTTSDSILASATSDGGTTDKMLQIVANSISSDTYPSANWSNTTLAQGGAFGVRVHANATITAATIHVRGAKT
jgi:hypothetical protein